MKCLLNGTHTHSPRTRTYRIYGVGGSPGEGTSVTKEAACEEAEEEEYYGVEGEHGKCVRVSMRGVEEVLGVLDLARTRRAEEVRERGSTQGTLHLQVCVFPLLR